MAGKMKSAIAFKIKIVPNATDISLSFAFNTGPTAAIALPPQIAVPEPVQSYEFHSNSPAIALPPQIAVPELIR